jgi:protein required for attachment to host cells
MHAYLLISDASRARLFEVIEKGRRSTRLVRQLNHPKSRLRAHDLVSDDRGRMNNGLGRQKRSVVEPRTQPQRVEEEVFAREVGRAMRALDNQEPIVALALVAPPSFTGLLREKLGKRLQRRVVTTLEKDLTGVPAGELGARLADTIQTLRARLEQSKPAGVQSSLI